MSVLLAHAPSTAQAAANHPAFKVDVRGNAGQPVILIPGLASSGEVWNGTVARYCGQRQCHVLTLAGFGGNPAVEGPLLANVEQQLSDYIATNKLDRPIVTQPGGSKLTFIHDPWGTSIELNERPNPL